MNEKVRTATIVSQESEPIENNKQTKTVISVRHVSKKFCRNLRRSMAYGIVDLSKNLLGIKPDSTTLRQSEFWALNDINFELRKGDTLGIIGMNGSGKTTLLRLLSGIFPPDKGEIMVKGRVGALVAVGAGFHPHMTGRENILLNGTVLGMTKKEIQAKFQDIVEFSEIGEFLDAPISTYSSGMRVRLGFAIAIHCEPDILLVDEILSVGDLSFRNKSLQRMEEYRKKANAVIFVSHNMEQVRVLCNRLLILDQGRVIYAGETHQGVAYYEEKTKDRKLQLSSSVRNISEQKITSTLGNHQSQEINLIDIGLLSEESTPAQEVEIDAPLCIYADFDVLSPINDLFFTFAVLDNDTSINAIRVVSNDHNKVHFAVPTPGKYRLRVRIQSHHLTAGLYKLQLAIRNARTNETYSRALTNFAFNVKNKGTISYGRGLIQVQEEWNLEKMS